MLADVSQASLRETHYQKEAKEKEGMTFIFFDEEPQCSSDQRSM
jgi:hypothetical protein